MVILGNIYGPMQQPGHTDRNEDFAFVNCPCSQFPGPLPQSFVYNSYYCESGSDGQAQVLNVSTSDPVWDGEGCSSDNNCCSEPNLPWFYRQLPLTSNEDIETRLCHDEPSSLEDVLIKELQLYVLQQIH